jgi:23S rRNA (adenine2503-C2)-methyltransferase
MMDDGWWMVDGGWWMERSEGWRRVRDGDLKIFDGKQALSGVTAACLEKILAPLPAFRARQIFKWINGGAASFEGMSNLPKALRHELDGRFTLRSTQVESRVEDADGSVKLQIGLCDGARIEAVVLQDGTGRRTACLSTQAGCAMGCVFCKTGSLGFLRNLSAPEIVEQLLHIRAEAGDISNIVFMGMGEPLLNAGELRQAIAVLTDSGLSPRRITVSTCGIVNGITGLAENGPPVRLAVSVTSARETLRRRLMPGAAGSTLAELKEALLHYQNRRGKRITLEAVLLGGINTGAEDVRALALFAKDLKVLINLIPWNYAEGLRFEGRPLSSPEKAEVDNFTAALEKAGLKTVVRYSKGCGAAGACGQLGATGRLSPLPSLWQGRFVAVGAGVVRS